MNLAWPAHCSSIGWRQSCRSQLLSCLRSCFSFCSVAVVTTGTRGGCDLDHRPHVRAQARTGGHEGRDRSTCGHSLAKGRDCADGLRAGHRVRRYWDEPAVHAARMPVGRARCLADARECAWHPVDDLLVADAGRRGEIPDVHHARRQSRRGRTLERDIRPLTLQWPSAPIPLVCAICHSGESRSNRRAVCRGVPELTRTAADLIDGSSEAQLYARFANISGASAGAGDARHRRTAPMSSIENGLLEKFGAGAKRRHLIGQRRIAQRGHNDDGNRQSRGARSVHDMQTGHPRHRDIGDDLPRRVTS
jgi:hypothetical protein